MFVGRDSELPGGHPKGEMADELAFTSLNDARELARGFPGTCIPAWWDAEMIADQILQILAAIPPTAQVPDYSLQLRALFA